jgi:hypothetical protein
MKRKLNQLLSINKYDSRLVLQLDETSLCVKSSREAKKVVSYERKYIPSLKIPPIYRCTALLTIQLSDNYIKPHLLFAKSHKFPFKEIQPKHSYIHINEKGWMEKVLFEDIMQNYILKEIQSIRASIPFTECRRALIILDGHSSRLNRRLWELFREEQIDVLILPAHTSEYLQPLDMGVNGVFKGEIKHLRFPRAKAPLQTFKEFVQDIEDAIDKACTFQSVRHSWENANVCAGDSASLLKELLKDKDEKSEVKKGNRFSISGELVTDETFLLSWKEHEDKMREPKQCQQRKRKSGEGESVERVEEEKEIEDEVESGDEEEDERGEIIRTDGGEEEDLLQDDSTKVGISKGSTERKVKLSEKRKAKKPSRYESTDDCSIEEEDVEVDRSCSERELLKLSGEEKEKKQNEKRKMEKEIHVEREREKEKEKEKEKENEKEKEKE